MFFPTLQQFPRPYSNFLGLTAISGALHQFPGPYSSKFLGLTPISLALQQFPGPYSNFLGLTAIFRAFSNFPGDTANPQNSPKSHLEGSKIRKNVSKRSPRDLFWIKSQNASNTPNTYIYIYTYMYSYLYIHKYIDTKARLATR